MEKPENIAVYYHYLKSSLNMGCSARPRFAMQGNTHPDTESKNIDVSGAARDNSLTKITLSLSLSPPTVRIWR